MRKILLFSLICFTVQLFAQQRQNGRPYLDPSKTALIKGKINTASGEPIPYASIGVYKIIGQDTILKKGAASDQNGYFELRIKKDAVISLQFSFLSYRSKWMHNVTANNTLSLGIIVLEENDELLNEVIVEADKSQMELKLDKRVFNVGKDLTNKGANASDILETVPSVEVDMEGNVSLRGSENVRILIDGKPSGLLSGNLADALKQLQGDLIEKIEVITNPSARYDAEGEVGIINIVLKNDKQKGTSASVNVTTGLPHNHRVNTSFSLRKKNYSIFGGANGGYSNGIGGGTSLQTYNFPDTNYSYNRNRQHARARLSQMGNIGTEINVNKTDMLSISGSVSGHQGENKTTIDYLDYDIDNILTATEQRVEIEESNNMNANATLAYYKGSKEKDKEWNTVLKRIYSESDEIGLITETVNDIINPVLQRTSTITNDQTWYFQSDFIYQIKEDSKFETGVKTTSSVMDTDYGVSNDLGYIIRPIAEYDNHLIYEEQISAAYMMYGSKHGSIAYQLGLRGEYSDITTSLLQTNEINPRTYLNWFPSAHLSYEMSENTSLQASYSKRISRPRHWWLNPFYGLSDDRNFFTGNPNLDPELTDAYELSYLRKFDKGSVLASAYYRLTDNVMQRVTLVDSLGNTVMKPFNIGTEDAYGLEINGQYNVNKAWTTSTNINFFRSIIEGEYEGLALNANAFNYRVKLNSRWRLKKGWKAQTSFNYRAPAQSPQGRRLAIYHWNGGFSKDILKRKGTLTFTARDILNSRKRRSITEGPFYYLDAEFQWRSRSVTLNFSYRFNQKPGRKRGSGSDYDAGDMDMGM